jgi:hypothetical protein
MQKDSPMQLWRNAPAASEIHFLTSILVGSSFNQLYQIPKSLPSTFEHTLLTDSPSIFTAFCGACHQ